MSGTITELNVGHRGPRYRMPRSSRQTGYLESLKHYMYLLSRNPSTAGYYILLHAYHQHRLPWACINAGWLQWGGTACAKQPVDDQQPTAPTPGTPSPAALLDVLAWIWEQTAVRQATRPYEYAPWGSDYIQTLAMQAEELIIKYLISNSTRPANEMPSW
jgi:hypothetical protein